MKISNFETSYFLFVPKILVKLQPFLIVQIYIYNYKGERADLI